MKDNEMYMGFDPKKQAEYEREAIELWGEPAGQQIEESKRRTKGWKKEDFERVKKDYDELHRAFTEPLRKGIAPGAAEVQSLVKQHYAVIDRFWTPTRESYIGLGKTYCEHPDFRKLFDSYHPNLAEYLAETMKIYADCELKAGARS